MVAVTDSALEGAEHPARVHEGLIDCLLFWLFPTGWGHEIYIGWKMKLLSFRFEKDLMRSATKLSNMKTVFFDLETQYLFQELGMKDYNSRDPTKLKLAVAGLLSNKEHLFFEECHVQELFKALNQADLIVGHNLFRFDYLVLQPYFRQDIIKILQNKTFDIMLELEKTTGCWVPLDDLCERNIGLTKTIDTMKIPRLWREGQHQSVKDYLLNDLKMTEAIFNHAKNIKNLKYEHKEYGKSLGEREVCVKW